MDMKRHASIIVCLVALGVGAVTGCKTDTPGVKNVAGTYTATLDAPPDRVTNAARAAVEQLGLRDIKSNPTKVDGWVSAKTANNEPVNIDVSQDGANRSKVSIRVGVVGDDSISKRIYEKIRDNL
jgi:hypothetical protein